MEFHIADIFIDRRGELSRKRSAEVVRKRCDLRKKEGKNEGQREKIPGQPPGFRDFLQNRDTHIYACDHGDKPHVISSLNGVEQDFPGTASEDQGIQEAPEEGRCNQPEDIFRTLPSFFHNGLLNFEVLLVLIAPLMI